jgi:hypothetical protein
MTVPILATDYILVRVWTALGQQAAVNSLYYNVTGLTGTVTSQTIAGDMDGLFGDATAGLVPLIANAATYRGVQVYLPKRSPLPFPVFSNNHAAVGTGGANAGAKQGCPIITYYTDFTGPANRGRSYFPFISASSMTPGGDPSTAYLTAMRALFLTYQSVIVGSGGNQATLNLVVFHRSSKTGTLVTSSVAQPKMATMKKRGDYGRTNFPPF